MTDVDIGPNGSGTKGWVLDILRVHGLATILVIGMFYGLWRSVQWSGDKVVLPLVDRQIKLMDTLDKSSKEQTSLLLEMTKLSAEIPTNGKKLDILLQHSIGKTEENNTMLRELTDRLPDESVPMKTEGPHE